MNLKTMTEAELREVPTLWPKTSEELNQIISDLTDRVHDYGTSVYAMSLCAEAAFNYAASKVGSSGFQASCADLDFIKRTRGMKDGFSIIDYNKLLYPQYLSSDHFPNIATLMEKNKEHLKKRAKELLDKDKDGHASKSVRDHWQMILDMP